MTVANAGACARLPRVTVVDPEVLEIGGQKLGRGAREEVCLEFARLPTGTVIDTRVHVFRGAEPGPTLLLQGGLHGDEVGGIEVLRRMLKRDLFDIDRGTVLVVPILNVFGFIHFSREVPDGKDVNRSFPGSRRGSLASRVAYHYTKGVFGHVHFAIDFHTGGARRDNYPQVRYTGEDPASHALAKVFGAPFLLPSKMIPKSFRKIAHSKGVPIAVYEAGESLRLDNFAVEQGILGALRVMEHLGLIAADPARAPESSVQLRGSRWLRAGRAGLFSPAVANGSWVTKGEILGAVSRVHGGTEDEVRAPNDGYVICVNNQAVVNQGDALMHLAHA